MKKIIISLFFVSFGILFLFPQKTDSLEIAKPGFVKNKEGGIISLTPLFKKKKINVVIFFTIYDKYSILLMKKLYKNLSTNKNIQIIAINFDSFKEQRRNLRQKVELKKIPINIFYDVRNRIVKRYFGRKEIIRGAVIIENGVIIKKMLDSHLKDIGNYFQKKQTKIKK